MDLFNGKLDEMVRYCKYIDITFQDSQKTFAFVPLERLQYNVRAYRITGKAEN